MVEKQVGAEAGMDGKHAQQFTVFEGIDHCSIRPDDTVLLAKGYHLGVGKRKLLSAIAVSYHEPKMPALVFKVFLREVDGSAVY